MPNRWVLSAAAPGAGFAPDRLSAATQITKAMLLREVLDDLLKKPPRRCGRRQNDGS